MKAVDPVITELERINESAKSASDDYKLVKVSQDSLLKQMDSKGYDADAYYDFMKKEYNISKSDVKSVDTDDNIMYYIKTSTLNKIKYDKFIKDMNATVKEFYGVVQLDGDEPDARGNYNSDYDDDLLTSPNNAMRKKQKETDAKVKKKLGNPKSSKDESTDASAVPSKAGASTVPVLKKRKKVINN